MKKYICSKCKWFDVDSDLKGLPRRGKCRINPAIIVSGGSFSIPQTEWPIVMENDWCGKFYSMTNV